MKTFEQMVAEDKEFTPIRNAFFDSVCQHGLWQRIDEVDDRGMSGSFGDVELRSYVIAGRTMITIANKDNQITFLTDDRERNGIGLHTTEGDAEVIKSMVRTVIYGWPDDVSDQRNTFKANSKIQIGF